MCVRVCVCVRACVRVHVCVCAQPQVVLENLFTSLRWETCRNTGVGGGVGVGGKGVSKQLGCFTTCQPRFYEGREANRVI